MMVAKKTLILGLLLVVQLAQAQKTDRAVVIKAMEDEMSRSMSELSLKDHDRPFFISYTITDYNNMAVGASFGAVVDSNEGPARNSSVRVIVGDYDFNDESFTDGEYELGLGGYEESFGQYTMSTPLGSDYYGIRRDLWASTDNVYRSAASKYKKMKDLLEKDGKDIDSIPHLRFAKVPIEQYEDKPIVTNWDKKALEARARKLSAIFLEYPDLIKGTVSFSLSHEIRFYLNSEGTRLIEESVKASVYVGIGLKSEENSGSRYLDYSGESLDQLPTDEALKKEIEKTIASMAKTEDIPKFDDSYEGPVLFYGETIGSLIRQNMLSSFNGMKRATLVPNEWEEEPIRSLERKMNKRVTSRNISVTLMPGALTYKGQKMNGAYRYDREGVKATDSLLVIEKGYLRNMVYSRNVLADSIKPSGMASGKGVVSIVSHKTATEAELKQQLIELAEDEGLEYAIIVRPKETDRYDNMQVFMVSLEDGSETQVRSAMVNDMNFNSFRKIEATSADRVVTESKGGSFIKSADVIAPRIMLIEDVAVEYSGGYMYPNRSKKGKKVPSPLAKKK